MSREVDNIERIANGLAPQTKLSTAQEPPPNPWLRDKWYNHREDRFDVWDGDKWVPLAEPPTDMETILEMVNGMK